MYIHTLCIYISACGVRVVERVWLISIISGQSKDKDSNSCSHDIT